MTRPDHTNTEHQAGRSARADSWAADEADLDEPVVVELGHDCAQVPFPDTCLGCLGWERHWVREREAINEANDKEWFS